MDIISLSGSDLLNMADQVSELHQACFGSPMGRDYLEWRFVRNPLQDVLVNVAMEGGRMAAFYAVSPLMLNLGKCTADSDPIGIGGHEGSPILRHGEDSPRGSESMTFTPIKAALSLNTMTGPDFRGKGLFVQLARHTYRQMEERGYQSLIGFSNCNSNRTFSKVLGVKTVYEVPMMEKVLSQEETDRFREMGRKLSPTFDDAFQAGEGTGEGTGTTAGAESEAGKRSGTGAGSDFEAGSRSRSAAESKSEAGSLYAGHPDIPRPLSVHKSREYLRWRYGRSPEAKYTNVLLEDENGHGRPRGYGVCKVWRDRLNVVELHCPGAVATQGTNGDASALNADTSMRDIDALLDRIMVHAVTLGCGVVTTWAPLNTDLHYALERRGFINRYPVQYFNAMPMNGLSRSVDITDSRNWRLQLGDNNTF